MSEEITTEEFLEDLDRAKAEVEKIQQSNVAKVQTLAQFGKGIDPASLANLKVDTFIQTFLDRGAQLVYLRTLELQLRELLDEALGAARQEQIMTPNPKKGLIIPR